MKNLSQFGWLLLLLPACLNNNETTKSKKSDQEKIVSSCAPPQTTDQQWYNSGKKAPLLVGLEGINFHISTDNEEAQLYFNQGMMLAYGFNHAEAARSFYEAMRLDFNFLIAFGAFQFG